MPGSYTLSSGKAFTLNAPKAVKAKCEDNQQALDRLQERMIKAQSNPNGSNYCSSMRRAIKSLQDCPHPITTQKQACELKYVGQNFAKIIVPHASSAAGTATQTGKKGGTKKIVAPSMKRLDSTSVSSVATASSKSDVTASVSTAASAPSAKEKAYNKAKKDGQNQELPPTGPWKVILLVDGREHKSKQVVSQCKQSGIPCEERHLPIGDMAWIAQCIKPKTQGMSSEPSKPIEIMIGTIIERKDVGDLASSLYGTRYSEQRLRLSKCGLPQVLFLVEGDVNQVPNCPAETLHMAMMETRIQLGFQIVQTKNLSETVRVLKGLHRRIVQRTFPEVFDKDAGMAVPSFVADPNEVGHRLGSGNSESGRRRNRRPSSLLEMVFDTTPKPPFGTSRFITYAELKAKVEFDREQGTRSVQAITMAMLKQIPRLSQKKCTAIAQEFPTMNRLIETLCFSEGNPEKLFSDIAVGKQSMGPKSASEVVAACCTLGDGSTVSSSTVTEEPAKKKVKRTKASSSKKKSSSVSTTAPAASSSSVNDRNTTPAVAVPARAATAMFPIGNDDDDSFSDDSFTVAPVGSFDSRKRLAAGSSNAAATKTSTARRESRFVTNLDDSLLLSSPDDFVPKRHAASSKPSAGEAPAAAAERRAATAAAATTRAYPKTKSSPLIIDIADSDSDNDSPPGSSKTASDRYESDLQRAIRLSMLDTPNTTASKATPGVPSGGKQHAARKVSNDSASRGKEVDDSLLLSSPEEETTLRARLANRMDREVIEIDLD